MGLKSLLNRLGTKGRTPDLPEPPLYFRFSDPKFHAIYIYHHPDGTTREETHRPLGGPSSETAPTYFFRIRHMFYSHWTVPFLGDENDLIDHDGWREHVRHSYVGPGGEDKWVIVDLAADMSKEDTYRHRHFQRDKESDDWLEVTNLHKEDSSEAAREMKEREERQSRHRAWYKAYRALTKEDFQLEMIASLIGPLADAPYFRAYLMRAWSKASKFKELSEKVGDSDKTLQGALDDLSKCL